MTCDVTRGQPCLISCCLYKGHPGESIFIAGTSVYPNPDVLGKCVKNFRRARHLTKFAGIINRDVYLQWTDRVVLFCFNLNLLKNASILYNKETRKKGIAKGT